MVRYWQWIKRWLFGSRSNKVFKKVNRITSLCDYSDAYTLVKGDIAVARTVAAAGDVPLQALAAVLKITSST